MFQPSPGYKAGCYGEYYLITTDTEVFQPSPGYKAGCYADERTPEAQVEDVSTLTRL